MVFQSHVLQLAKHHGIRVVMDSAITYHEAGAAPMQKTVHVPIIVTATDYAVALHEIGHCVAPGGFRIHRNLFPKQRPVELAEERAAWAWAVEQAVVWNADMQAIRDYALSTYEA